MTGKGLAFVLLALHRVLTLFGRFYIIDQRMAKILYSRLVIRFRKNVIEVV
jgi:hypothetical protein